jgi:iron(III) transport system substrate-binding protein
MNADRNAVTLLQEGRSMDRRGTVRVEGMCGLRAVVRTFRVALVALVTIAVIAACQRSGSEVVVYTSEDQIFSEPVLKEFERTSGIKVRAVYDTEETKSTGVALRVVAERERPQADVFWANEPLRAVMLQQQGLLAAYRSPSADDISARYRDPGDYWTGFSARARVILYNTDEVKPDAVPSSVRDLTDPRWKGRAGLANPLFGTTTTQVAALAALWGEPAARKFLDDIKANGVRIVTSNGEAKDLVASGELAWAFTDTDDASEAVEQRKPVAVVYPDQDSIGTLVMPNAVALVKGAPHPEAAKKLIDYLLSRQVEERLARSTAAQMPLHRDVSVPPNVKPVSAIKDMAVTYATLGGMIDGILPYLRRWSGAS